MPRRVALVTDSTSDLLPQLTAERGISVIPLTLTLDGTDYLDGVDITPAEFYGLLTASKGIASTSQPSPGRFAETYERLLADHDAILSLHISSDLSGTYAAARQGAELVAANRITVIDTRLVSMALGLIVLAADQALDEGATAEQAWERTRPLASEMRVYFMVGTLEYLRRGGRIGGASALVGSVLQIKPVLTLTNGVVAPLERVRTTEKALARVIELARGTSPRLCAAIGHVACPELADRVAAGIEDQCESLLFMPVGPVVGAHGGPGLVGVGCYPAELFPLGLGKVMAPGAN
jgi:DegV family protein with EDD domain